ncbi:hypothetical protein [Janibacter alittae]|uniref:site-specific DNA-methyltransferase (adenine-specific) n=1 Tax=Janibacter alittae TaxID=3115209 RepID=A0ABZ2MIK1_9MICO
MTLAVEELVVRSRERVKAHGEVFTPRYMVDQMLDLVSEDLESSPDFVDKTFLEPSAGGGNFLVAILRRKLQAIEKRFPANEWAQESLFALASIYGIELLEDNHQEAKAIMLAEFLGFHRDHGTPCSNRTNLHRAAAFLIDTNIVHGNTLTSQDWRGQEIQFSWWHRSLEQPGIVEREPFSFRSLRDNGALDFAVYEVYAPCPINRVHQEVTAS